MIKFSVHRTLVLIFSVLVFFLNSRAFSFPQGNDQAPSFVQPSTYVVDLIANASFGVDMNDAGDVIGTSYPDPGCGSTCLPPLETVVWKNGLRIVLPTVPGLPGITVTGINNQGWICGWAGSIDFTHHAVVWKPSGSTYSVIDLGNLPGKTYSGAIGIDELGRVVGWSSTASYPSSGTPFMWTESGGMIDLPALGFPTEIPLGISPGGTVATGFFWYHLGDPSSVVSMPPPPTSFYLGFSPVAINDNGDQARFLGSGTQGLIYPFRFHHEGGGTWQQISFVPTGHLSSAGVGSINDTGDITLTVASAGMIAYGPDGLAQLLTALISPAYGGSVPTFSGSMNEKGEILANMIIGQSGQRLVRLVPDELLCTTNCIKVTSILMKGKGPAFCNQGQAIAKAKVTVTDQAGVKLSGVTVTGHFFDDYWLDQTVVGTTNVQGNVTFTHIGPPCVGAIALLITDATISSRTFDRTIGILTNYVLPLPLSEVLEQEELLDFEEVLVTEKINSELVVDIPKDYSLSQNYPNPFNPSTSISYGLKEDANVSIIIYNALGVEIATLVNSAQPKGLHSVVWSGMDNSGIQVTSGIYFYRMIAGSFVETKKMILLK